MQQRQHRVVDDLDGHEGMLVYHGIVGVGAVDLVPLHVPLAELSGKLGHASRPFRGLGGQRGNGARRVYFAVSSALDAGEAGKGAQRLVPDGLARVRGDVELRHVDVEFLNDGGATEAQG